MSRKRIRYQWFQDIPRNVTRREYEQYQLRNFATIALGGMAALMAIGGISGLTLQTSRKLAEIEAMSVEDAVAYGGDRIELIQLEGYLVTDDPLVMPDDEAQKVIRGRVNLVARADTDSDTTDPEALVRRETLFEWEETAASVLLSDGDHRIPLAFDLAVLPMEDDSFGFSPRTVREGESSRVSRPVAIEYGDEVYPLPLEQWGEVDSVFKDFERETLPYGQSVVVVASLETTVDGNRLIDPLGNRLQVLMGTGEEIRREGQQARVMFLLLPIPLGFASFRLGKSARQLRQGFIERSNQ
ncbi:hypothetical protein D0962_34270 [Leptolyngbyaceae cyanobacterium CCMR0082]|uniref:Uncharacterized protein n=2 Tax=Adonisia turfae TaxID=2950184 RepID=A0A6M0SHG0_9CYAN|nr:hypothetical protein [Adonisia turfae]NEZ60250.1 hypothetical protein [Adonisia turfae CCMR0081]NEZ67766.1 hypothetical protein [Adonisia turfae CCMR0082]